MVSKFEPDRYANTGFSIKDTSPEVNEMLFAHVMSLTVSQRFMMGLDLTNLARRMVWDRLPEDLAPYEKRRAFYENFYGEPYPVPRERDPGTPLYD